MKNLKSILIRRFQKAEKHFEALTDYKNSIDQILTSKNIFAVDTFNNLSVNEKALLDAYLKRFSSLQDFLGAKIFPLVFELAGFPSTKMSEVISNAEKEGIIDSISDWIELRQIRNELEHEYPDELVEALNDLEFCVNSYSKLSKYFQNVKNYSEKLLK